MRKSPLKVRRISGDGGPEMACRAVDAAARLPLVGDLLRNYGRRRPGLVGGVRTAAPPRLAARMDDRRSPEYAADVPGLRETRRHGDPGRRERRGGRVAAHGFSS